MVLSFKKRMCLSRYFNVLFIIFAASTLFIIIILFSNESDSLNADYKIEKSIIAKHIEISHSHESDQIKKVECQLPTGHNSLKCLSTNNRNMYVPFDFVAKKFDMNDKVLNNGAHLLSFSYAQINSPDQAYNSSDEYLWFNGVNVEERDRVKYISLIHGVPISSQWKPSGHIYPIQVGQFGLSYFSKWIRAQKLTSQMTGENKFIIKGKEKFIHYSHSSKVLVNSTLNSFEFQLPEKSIYKMDYSKEIIYLIANVSTSTSFELMVDIMLRDHSLERGSFIVRLTYKVNSFSESGKVEENISSFVNDDNIGHVEFSLKGIQSTFKFVRNFCLDACKGLKLKCSKCKSKASGTVKSYYKVYQISLKGKGRIENGLFTNQQHTPNLELANQAVDYLLYSQDANTGGWPIHVLRKFDKASGINLKTPWYSAMGQGHAISLLSRFYAHFKQEKHILSAGRALNLLNITTQSGGVKAYFQNSTDYWWYEEYPTQPYSLFVLNGFMYSMFGIFDFISVYRTSPEIKNNTILQAYSDRAVLLYKNGLRSLQRMISSYDSGIRSFYDLRHLSNPKVNPNIARWDYHKLHVSQLNYLISIIDGGDFKDLFNGIDVSLFKTIRKRWSDYTIGKWNKNSQIKP